jgi:hypothetical protein
VTDRDVVVEWDVVDGGILGAVIECGGCAGKGHYPVSFDGSVFKWCVDCDRTGRLHRPYSVTGSYPATVTITVSRPDAYGFVTHADSVPTEDGAALRSWNEWETAGRPLGLIRETISEVPDDREQPTVDDANRETTEAPQSKDS